MDNQVAGLNATVKIDTSDWDKGIARLQANITQVVQQFGNMASSAAGSLGRLTGENEKAAEATNLNTKAVQALSAQLAQIRTPSIAPGFQQATPAIGATEGAVTRLASAMQFLKRSFVVGELLDMARSVIGFGQSTADAQSAVRVNMNRVDVLFGQSAGQVEAWSQTTAASMGLSQRASLQAAAGFGNLFRDMGFGQKVSADLSEALTKTAANLAAFTGKGNTEQAFKALEAAIGGNARGMRQFGVILTPVTEKAEALRLGLIKSVKEGLSPQERALSSLSIVARETGNAQGALAKNADLAAVSARVLSANIENLSAKFGQLTLPIKQQATQALNGFLERVNGMDFHAIIAAFEQFGDSIWQTVAGKIKPVTDFFVAQWQKVVSWFHENLPLMQKTVKTVVDFITEEWRAHGAQILAVIRPVWQQITSVISTALTLVLDAVKFGMEVITGDWKGAGETIKSAAKDIWSFVLGTFKNVGSYLAAAGRAILSVALDMAHRLGIAILGIGKTIAESVGGFAERIVDCAGEKFAAAGAYLGHAVASGIFTVIRSAFGAQAADSAQQIAHWAETTARLAQSKIQGVLGSGNSGASRVIAAGQAGPAAAPSNGEIYGPPAPSPFDTLMGRLRSAAGSGVVPKDNTPTLSDAIKAALSSVNDQASAPGFGASAGKAAAKALHEQAAAWREAMAARRELYAAIRPREEDKFEIRSDTINEHLAKLLQSIAGNPKAIATIGKKAIADAAKALEDNRKRRDAFYANVRAHNKEEAERRAKELARQADEAAKKAGEPLRTVQNALAGEQARALRIQAGQDADPDAEAADTKRALALQLLHKSYESLALPIRNVLDQLGYLKDADEEAIKSHAKLAEAAKKTAEAIRTQAVDALKLQAEQTHKVSEGMAELASRFDGMADHSDRLAESFHKFGIEQATATAGLTADVKKYSEAWDQLDALEKQRRQIVEISQAIEGPLDRAFETTFSKAKLSAKTFFDSIKTDVGETLRNLAAKALAQAVTGGILHLLGQASASLDNNGIDKKAAAARDDLFRAADRLDHAADNIKAAAAALANAPLPDANTRSNGGHDDDDVGMSTADTNAPVGNVAGISDKLQRAAFLAGPKASTVSNLLGVASSTGTAAAQGFANPISDILAGLSLTNLFKFKFAAGAWEVPGHGIGDHVPAMLSPGEMVIPKTYADGIRNGRGGASGGDDDSGGDTYHNEFHNVTINDKADADRIKAMMNREMRMKFRLFGYVPGF